MPIPAFQHGRSEKPASLCRRHPTIPAEGAIKLLFRPTALAAFHNLCRFEGIIPALESSHALAHAAKIAPTMDKDKILLVNLSGRGDKDINTVAKLSGIEL